MDKFGNQNLEEMKIKQGENEKEEEVKIILIPSAISKPVTSEAEAQPESPTESIYSYESFISQLDNAWQEVLSHFLSSGYFKSIYYWVSREYTKTQCRPIYSQIFTAFNLTSFENIKIVIIGQEPYTGPNEAMGLSFSVPHGVKIPASLKNVFKSMQQDPNLSFNPPQHGDLSPWARQGVFLLNSVLTVRQGAANSHARKVWERFSDEVIKVIDTEKTNVVFMLWGAYAQEKGKVVDRTKHLVLETCHPSPLSAFKGGFFEAHHFSKANEYLRCHGKGQIDWSLEY